MTKEDSERKKNYANEYNKRASDIATGKSVPLPGGPVPFYYTIKALDKISKGITNLFLPLLINFFALSFITANP